MSVTVSIWKKTTLQVVNSFIHLSVHLSRRRWQRYTPY